MEEKATKPTKRVRRSKDEVVSEKIQKFEEKIAEYKAKISEMEAQLYALRNPAAPPIKIKDIKNRASELGVSLDDLMEAVEKLGQK